jgi:hypothetical protein
MLAETYVARVASNAGWSKLTDVTKRDNLVLQVRVWDWQPYIHKKYKLLGNLEWQGRSTRQAFFLFVHVFFCLFICNMWHFYTLNIYFYSTTFGSEPLMQWALF